ncbi:hypothetical protein [Streptomyces formicae]|uniref:Uncharacterized protein n=1 Tax=Streptomyces formicae TaxID=1616117 RepID=A0ABY3WIK3_9ACTN|nr:hypothetical protein [Streptomyces formicae]UNM12424.1 hypothetical protein J4032_13550 [Streptomyces formicae]
MAIDPIAAVNAIIRAEAARTGPSAEPDARSRAAAPEPEPEPAPPAGRNGRAPESGPAR